MPCEEKSKSRVFCEESISLRNIQILYCVSTGRGKEIGLRLSRTVLLLISKHAWSEVKMQQYF